MKFRMLSPVTVSVPDEKNGKFGPHYLRYDDPRLGDCLRTNTVNKFASLCGSKPEDTTFECTLDSKFIEEAEKKGRKISRLVTIKKGRADETQVRGFMCPVTIEGNPELIKLAYVFPVRAGMNRPQLRAETLAQKEYDPNTEINPFAHIIFDTIILNQINQQSRRRRRSSSPSDSLSRQA